MSGLLGGLGGAFIGNELFGNRGQGSGDFDNYPQDGGWNGDGGGTGWGDGGGDSGGGDSGGGW